MLAERYVSVASNKEQTRIFCTEKYKLSFITSMLPKTLIHGRKSAKLATPCPVKGCRFVLLRQLRPLLKQCPLSHYHSMEQQFSLKHSTGNSHRQSTPSLSLFLKHNTCLSIFCQKEVLPERKFSPRSWSWHITQVTKLGSQMGLRTGTQAFPQGPTLWPVE